MSKPMRVLVVDDCADNARSLALLIKMWGHDVRVAHDATSALGIAESERRGVIVLDIGLPDLNGYELARLLKEQQAPQRPLLVAVTGYGQERDRRHSQEAGFTHHLLKPIVPAELQELLSPADR